jgi:hypothetical protein
MKKIKFYDDYCRSHAYLGDDRLYEGEILVCIFPDGTEKNVKIKMHNENWVVSDMTSGSDRGSYEMPHFYIDYHGLNIRVDKLHEKPLFFRRIGRRDVEVDEKEYSNRVHREWEEKRMKNLVPPAGWITSST